MLVLRCLTRQRVAVGRAGEYDLQPGYYLYVGSAFGPGGLRARLERHARLEKRLRWHIDYLRAVLHFEEAWYTVSDRQVECDWAAQLAAIRGITTPFAGLGASDCRCFSHLFYLARSPSRRGFSARTTERIYRWRPKLD